MAMLLTDEEREKFVSLQTGSYYGQIGITIRFGNHFWHECSGSLLAGACGGDNLPTLIKVSKRAVPRGTKTRRGFRKSIMCFDSKVSQMTWDEVSSTILESTYKETPVIVGRG